MSEKDPHSRFPKPAVVVSSETDRCDGHGWNREFGVRD